MSFQLSDLLSRRLDPMFKQFQQALDTVATYTLFKPPSGLYGAPGGIKQTVIVAIVFTNPNAILGGTVTLNIGGNAAINDFLASVNLTIPTTANDTVYLAPNTTQLVGAAWVGYTIGQTFQLQVTAGGTAGSKADIVGLGFTE